MEPEPGYALVTGASRGLGTVFARTLAARGYDLVLAARSGERLDALASELRSSQNIKVETIALDLAVPGAGSRLAAELNGRGIGVDLLVNNAGFGDQTRFLDVDLDRHIEGITLQNSFVVELIYHLLPAMIEKCRGSIINVSSMAGFQPVPYAAVYSATKSFLTTFSLALEAELSDTGIKVVTLCPGRLMRAQRETIVGADRKKVPGGEQSPDEVATAALDALYRGGGLVVPGGVNKLAAFAGKLVPRGKIAGLTKKLSKPPDKEPPA